MRPTRSSRLRGLLAVLAIAMLVPTCGETVTRIRLDSIGRVGEVQLPLAAGTRLLFGAIAAKYSYTDAKDLKLKVELLRKGKVVETMTCGVLSFADVDEDKASGCGCYRHNYSTACQVIVPEGGATAIRAETWMDVGSAEISGLEIDVRRR